MFRFIFFFGLSASFAAAQANPGWLQSSPDPAVAQQWVSPASTGGLPPVTQTENLGGPGNDADTITPEIQALADGLQNDAWRIYQYCHDHIEFEPYWGAKKGATLTYLEGSGNAFDTAALMVALLRASGYEDVEYRYGLRDLPDYDAQDWLSIANQLFGSAAPFGHFDDTEFIAYAGSPPAGMSTTAYRFLFWNVLYLLTEGYPGVDPNPIGNYYDMGIPHVWVQFADTDSTIYEMDPAFKIRDKFIDQLESGVLTASGYDQSSFLSAAGGTTGGSTYVQNVNETQVDSQLTGYTTALSSWFKTSQVNAPTEDFIYDKKAKPHLSTGLAAHQIDASDYYGTSWIGVETWDTIPDQWMTKLEVTFGTGYDPDADTFTSTLSSGILTTAGLAGRKFSLTFTGNTANARLDETSWKTFSAAGSEVDVRLKVDHPHGQYDTSDGTWTDTGKTDQVEGKAYRKNDNFAYVFLYGFDPSGRHLRKRQEILQDYKRQGIADNDWRVRSELLNVMGLTWVNQSHLSSRMVDSRQLVLTLQHHTFGRMAQEEGYYVDVGLGTSGAFAYDAYLPAEETAFRTGVIFASALEHALIEQMQGEDKKATSTVKIMQLANEQGLRVYRATPLNWSSVRSTLSSNGYPAATLDDIEDALLDPGATDEVALIPAEPDVALNDWEGTGYAIVTDKTAAMIISGGYFGGYLSESDVEVEYQGIARDLTSDTSYWDTDGLSFRYAHPPSTTPQQTFADPVDVASGAFILDKEDLSCGMALPRGLSFSRHYHSHRRHDNTKGLGYGWTHNLDMRAVERSAITPVLGEATIRQMAPYLLATEIVSDLIASESTAKDLQVAMLTAKWAADQLLYKGVGVILGKATVEFVRMPDGTYEPPAGMPMSLTKTASGYELQERHGRTFTFGSDGNITTVTDQHGQSATFTYTSDRLIRVTDCYGRKLDLTWSGDTITKVTETAGALTRDVQFGYTGDQLTSMTDPEDATCSYVYDSENRITSLVDAKSQTIVTNTYDDLNRVKYQDMHGDPTKRWELFFSGYCNIERDPEGGETCHLYDKRGRNIGTIDQTGHRDRRIYDGEDHTVEYATPKNDSSSSLTRKGSKLTYNADHNVTQVEVPERESGDPDAPYLANREYDSEKRLWREYDFRGDFREYSYTTKHQVETIRDAKGIIITTNTYNVDGTLNTVTDADSNVTTWSNYNSYGNAGTITYPSVTAGGSPVSYTEHSQYNARGDLISSTDRRGNTTTFTYNKRRELLTTTLPPVDGVSSLLTNEYDSCGNLESITDARGNRTTYTYSPTLKLLATTLPPMEGGTPVITNSYDSRDWLVSTTDPLQNQTLFTYDAAHRLTVIADPLARETETAFNEDGEPIKTINGLGDESLVTFNRRGEVTQVQDEELRTVSYEYDEDGNRTSLTNRNTQTYNFTFDANSRLLTTQTPLGHTHTQTWNDRGLLASSTEPSTDALDFAYDALGRMSTVTVKDNGTAVSSINYEHDGNGNPILVSEGSQQLTRTFDERNRVKTFVDAHGNQFAYEYDANNNLTSLTYPDGKIVTYNYNSHNQLRTVTDWALRRTEYLYDLNGRLVQVRLPNGTSRRFSYDAAGQLVARSELDASGTPITYHLFTYDDAGRISTEKVYPQQQTFALSAPGAIYDHDNRLTSFDGSSVTHDTDGNMTSGPLPDGSLQSHVYDSRNRLAIVGSTSFSYDPANTLIGVSESGVTSDFAVIPDRGLSKILTRTKNGETTYYVYGAGLLYEVDEDENSSTYHYDYRGSTVAISTGDGITLSDIVEYSPYGTITYRIGATDTPFLFNGKYGILTFDNGLLSMRARFYNPYLRQFIHADPIGFDGGLNWYNYANGNPVLYVDPSGNIPLPIITGGIGAIVGGGVAYWKSGGDWNATLSGAVGGAVSGALIGTGAGLVGQLANGGRFAAAVGTSSGVGAVAGGAGNAVTQTAENMLQQNMGLGESIGNIEPQEVGIAMAIGGTLGTISGGISVSSTALRNATQHGQQAVNTHMTNVSASLQLQGASGQTLLNVQGRMMAHTAGMGARNGMIQSGFQAADRLLLPTFESGSNALWNPGRIPLK